MRGRDGLKQQLDEIRADLVLQWAGGDEERPFDREGRMVRRHSRSMVDGRWSMVEEAAESQEAVEELRFLADVANLRPGERMLVKLWIEGWTQAEIAGKLGRLQPEVSRDLKRAQRRCYDMAPVSFRRFSYKPLYRPRRRWEVRHRRVCAGCGDVFYWVDRAVRYCCAECGSG